MKERDYKLLVAFLLVTLGVVSRILPHPFNFTPITAIALFSGIYLGRRYAVAVPLIAMFISDIFFGFYELPLMLAVYSCFSLFGLAGYWLKKYKNIETVIGVSLGASIAFFAVTNWAVWQFSPWYAKTLSGLIECYALALPFFRNTLFGDLFYVGILFGAYELVAIFIKRRELCQATTK